MTQQTLPTKNTPLTAVEAVQALLTAYQEVTQTTPSAPVLALLGAQSSLETGGYDVPTILAILATFGFSSVQDFQRVKGLTPDDIAGPKTLAAMGNPRVPFGGWQRIPNYNFAGLKATRLDLYVQIFETEEVVSSVMEMLDQTFAAYVSAIDGAAAYVRQLLIRQAWWAGLQTGTPEGFVEGLTTSPRYFTASADEYLAGLKSRFATCLAQAQSLLT